MGVVNYQPRKVYRYLPTNHSLMPCFTLYATWLVKFYCDIISSRSHLQLINTFCSKLGTFLTIKEERPMMDKRKLDGAVGESLMD